MFKFEIGDKIFTPVYTPNIGTVIYEAQIEGRQTVEKKGKDGETLVNHIYTLLGLPVHNKSDYEPFQVEETMAFKTIEELAKAYEKSFIAMRIDTSEEGISFLKKNVQNWEKEIEAAKQYIEKIQEERNKIEESVVKPKKKEKKTK